MKNPLLPLSLLAAAMPLAAQTAPAATTPAHHATAPAGCMTVPTFSPNIPKLPVGASCPKVLYSITRVPDVKADYISPLVSPELRESLNPGVSKYSLGYIDVVKGTGDLTHPGKFVSVKYAGYLLDGTKFDASDDHPGKDPITFPYGAHRVIQGWDTGFEGMHVGGKRRLFIPYQLAYGEAGHGPIPAKSMLIFDVELTGVSDTEPKRTPPPPPAVKQTVPPATTNPAPSAANAPADSKTSPPAPETPKK